MEMTETTNTLLCPSWAMLLEWSIGPTDLHMFDASWPKWASGSPPTLVEFAAELEVPQCARLWLLARALHEASRRVCLLWTADCAEAALRTQLDEWQIDHALGVLGEVRRCAVTGEYLDTTIVDAADAANCFPTACAASAGAACRAADASHNAILTATAAYSGTASVCAAHSERAWQITLALGYLGVGELPVWPEGMTWR